MTDEEAGRPLWREDGPEITSNDGSNVPGASVHSGGSVLPGLRPVGQYGTTSIDYQQTDLQRHKTYVEYVVRILGNLGVLDTGEAADRLALANETNTVVPLVDASPTEERLRDIRAEFVLRHGMPWTLDTLEDLIRAGYLGKDYEPWSDDRYQFERQEALDREKFREQERQRSEAIAAEVGKLELRQEAQARVTERVQWAAKREFETAFDDLLVGAADVDRLWDDGYLVKNLAYRPGITLVHGDPGTGKSFASLDLACHVVTKRERWCGRRLNADVGCVLYIYSEGGARLKKRRDAWLTHHGLGRDDLEGLDFYPRAVSLVDGEGVVDALLDRITGMGYGLVIFDTWATSTVGKNENDVGDMMVALRRLGRLRDEGSVAVWVVHHDNKAGGFRGSTAIDGYVDTRLHLTRTGGRAERTVKLKTEKQRDDDDNVEITARLVRYVVGTDTDGDEISSVVFAYDEPGEDVTGDRRPPKRVYDMAAVAESLWRYLRFVVDPADLDNAPTVSDISRKTHESYVGSKGQKEKVIERMVRERLLTKREVIRTDAQGRPRPVQVLIPAVDAEGRFQRVLAGLDETE